jgi:SAM-dependent methyltransferase
MCHRIRNGFKCSQDCKENPKLNVGSGPILLEEFINYDIEETKTDGMRTDMFGNIVDINIQFAESTFAEIRCAHVIQQFRATEVAKMLRSFYRILRPGGMVVLEGPDVVKSFHHYVTNSCDVPGYIECLFAERDRNDKGTQWACRSGWTKDTAATAVREAGFSFIIRNYGLTPVEWPRCFRVVAWKNPLQR